MIKVDKKIPIPEIARGRISYPWNSMNVGDSFFVPADNFSQGAAGAQNSINGAALRRFPKKFSTRRVTENGIKGVRCWRIE